MIKIIKSFLYEGSWNPQKEKNLIPFFFLLRHQKRKLKGDVLTVELKTSWIKIQLYVCKE